MVVLISRSEWSVPARWLATVVPLLLVTLLRVREVVSLANHTVFWGFMCWNERAANDESDDGTWCGQRNR